MKYINGIKTKLQSQLRKLFAILILLTGTNAYFFWKTLDQLFKAESALSTSYQNLSLVSDVERGIVEESQLKQQGDLQNRPKIIELRKSIKENFGQLLDFQKDTKQQELVSVIQKDWTQAQSPAQLKQVLILLNSYVKRQKTIMSPHEQLVKDLGKKTKVVLISYVSIFALALLMMGQYFRRSIFTRLNRLTAQMQRFQDGQFPMMSGGRTDDEIGFLEGRFVAMATKINDTVSELKELDRVKTDFISIVSHELRTPMTSVKGSLSLLLSDAMGEVDRDIKEILTIAEKESDRLIRLINDILDLTKIEAKKMPIAQKWNSVDQVLVAATEGIQGFCETAGVKIEIAEAEAPVKAFFDKDRIQQVITNLLSNAIKFSPKGSTVLIGYTMHRGGVAISVVDQGPGISEEDQSRVFEKFASTDSGQAKIIRGTGLGLPICKAIVEQHGGEIGIQSIVGKGSTFYFTVPKAKIEDSSGTLAA